MILFGEGYILNFLAILTNTLKGLSVKSYILSFLGVGFHFSISNRII